jgi:hypothetical protein
MARPGVSPAPSSSAAKMAKITGYSPEELSIEHDYRKALKVLGVQLEDVDLRSEMHLPKGKPVRCARQGGRLPNKIDRMTGTTAASRRRVDITRYNPERLKMQASETESRRRQAKIDRIMGVSHQERALHDATMAQLRHNETMAQRTADAKSRERADRMLGRQARQEDVGVRVEIMYPDDELGGLSPEEFFTQVILSATMFELREASDILGDWKFRVLFDIFANQSVLKSQLQQKQQRGAGLNKVVGRGGAGGDGGGGGGRGGGGGSPKKRRSLNLFDAMKARRDRRRLKKSSSLEQEEAQQQQQLATPGALGLDHRAGLKLLSLLDSCSAVKSRVDSLRERVAQTRNGAAAARRSEKKLFRMILGPAIEALTDELRSFARIRGSANPLPLGAVDAWLEMSNFATAFLGHTTKRDAAGAAGAAGGEDTQAQHESHREECMQWCDQLAHEISDQAGPALKCHVDGFIQWLSVERWRLHNDDSYRFDPWYNVAPEDVLATLDYHRSASLSMENTELVVL